MKKKRRLLKTFMKTSHMRHQIPIIIGGSPRTTI